MMPQALPLIQRASRLLSVCLLVAGSGCSTGRSDLPQLVPVKGTVLLNGAPLPGATVQFLPEAGRSSIGRTDPSGQFELLYGDGLPGAVAGAHRVMITAAREIPGKTDGEGQPLSEQILPSRYNSRSELMAQVTAQTDRFEFALQNK